LTIIFVQQYVIVFVLLTTVFSLGFSSLAFGQGVQTSGGVDVDGTWYLGEGLKVGDYFEYALCEIDLNDCAPITFKMWIAGEKALESETLWDAKVLVLDGLSKVQWVLVKLPLNQLSLMMIFLIMLSHSNPPWLGYLLLLLQMKMI
jgi:hypothetical protein